VELSADFAPSMVTGLAKIGGITVGFIANQASKDEGRLTVYGAKKAARFVSFCDCFSIPVISIVDSMGMKVSTAPQGELSRAGAQLMFALAEASTVRIALIAGNAIGMAYASMASRAAADVVYAWPGAVISPYTAAVAVQLSSADELRTAADPLAKRAELEAKYQAEIADGGHVAGVYLIDVIQRQACHFKLPPFVDMLEPWIEHSHSSAFHWHHYKPFFLRMELTKSPKNAPVFVHHVHNGANLFGTSMRINHPGERPQA
jgi:acetyl-CoA carboxylase carboxyltransferase component